MQMVAKGRGGFFVRTEELWGVNLPNLLEFISNNYGGWITINMPEGGGGRMANAFLWQTRI